MSVPLLLVARNEYSFKGVQMKKKQKILIIENQETVNKILVLQNIKV